MNNTYSAFTWKFQFIGSKATIVADFKKKDLNTSATSNIWLFGAKMEPTGGQPVTGPYTDFYGSEKIYSRNWKYVT